jgi:tRNA (adenine37-N6)-methyltransferase
MGNEMDDLLSQQGAVNQGILYRPIGIIHTPHQEPRGTPIQASAALGIQGTVEILPEFTLGLQDLDGFSHLILLYHCHLCKEHTLRVLPFMDQAEHGVFATRAPARPNPIGLSVVRLIEMQKNMLTIQDVDMVDGTPLLDIKPYLPHFDVRSVDRIGWLQDNVQKLHHTKDDARFAGGPAKRPRRDVADG